jgi:YbgC/YbaW family acyl-CoA thioester hydrolase
MAHRTTFPVRFNELDPYGHVNHSVYVTYFEVGRTDAMAACEVPLQMLAREGFQMVVTRIEVDFRASAQAGDTIIVETEIGDLRRASGTWRQRILRSVKPGQDPAAEPAEDPAAEPAEQLLVSGLVTAGVTDRRGRPTKPPEWLFPALQALRPAEDGD